MAMMPARVKYRKQQRGIMRGVATRGNYVAFGEYGLQSLEMGWVTARQIEAGRVALSHFLQREGRVLVRIFPHKSVSGKPLEVRQGCGKGEPEYWCAVVKPGTVMFEISGVGEDVARLALSRVSHKMPVRCRFAKRRHAV